MTSEEVQKQQKPDYLEVDEAILDKIMFVFHFYLLNL